MFLANILTKHSENLNFVLKSGFGYMAWTKRQLITKRKT